MNISVIGGGPSGTSVARELALKGHDVHLFEDNPEIGLPCHCTGIVTKVLWDLIPKNKDIILNELHGVRVHAPNQTTTTIPLAEFVLDRAGLDKHLANRAIDAGVAVHYEHRFLDVKKNLLSIKYKEKTKEVATDVLIGADGPRSAVAKATNLFGDRNFYIGMQATVRGEFDPDVFDVWFGTVCPDFFAWLVPESATVARIGIAARQKPQQYFEPFVKKYATKILSYQGGPIPLFSRALRQFGSISLANDNSLPVYLVGDAGGLVKGTTGGGIITGMMSGKLCSQAILEEKNYETMLRPLKKELWIHERLRKLLNNFTDAEYDKLVQLLSKEKIQQILSEHPREFPSKFVWKLLFAEPRLAQFVRFA